MRRKSNKLQTPAILRRRAERPAAKRPAAVGAPRSQADATRLLHELEIHRIELAMQNAELRVARDETEAILAKYAALCDFASVGYFSLACDGTIRMANRTGSALAGIDRSRLVGRAFGRLLPAALHPAFRAFLSEVFAAETQQSMDAELLCRGQPPRAVTIEALRSPDGQECSAMVMSERLRALDAITWLTAIFLTTEDAIYTKTLDGVIMSWNPAAERMYGYSAGEIVGKSIARIIPPHRAGEAEALVGQLLRGEALTNFETERLRKDGALVRVSLSSALLRDRAGQAIGVSITARDITERKHAEDALRISEIRYRRLFEAAHDGVLLVDPGTRKITDANPFMTELLGYPRDHLIGRELFEIGLLKDEAVSRKMFRKLKRLKQVRYEDLPLERQDGRHQEVEVVANLYQENGRDVIQCNVRDISERKHAEGILAKAARKRLALSEVSARVVGQTAVQGVWDTVVGAARELTGASVAAAGQGDEHGGFRIGAASRANGGAEGPPCEVFKTGKGGVRQEPLNRNRPIRLTDRELREHPDWWGLPQTHAPFGGVLGVRLVNARGQPIGSIMVSDKQGGGDFTDEDELLLSQLASITSLAMQHIEARAAAEQADRAKDRFLAVLSHELRTPLTPVVIGLALLRDRADLDSKVREILEMVLRNVELETLLIDDLLDVTRISRGKIELHKQPVELCTVIQRAVEVCKPDIEARGLHFGVDMGPAAPYWIEADVARLQQVFWNLLKNAIKFTPAGGCVGIRCWPNERSVLAEVNDSGIGLQSESLSRVFNAFEQAEHSISRQFGGLGLGLAISKAMVEMHGGVIEAHSEGRDKGATFRMRLPLVVPPQALAAGGLTEAPAPAAPPRQPVRPLRILLVEDHGVTAKLTKMMLSAEGHRVETASDVATALELVGKKRFDLLMSDLGLPDGSGHELMRQLGERGHGVPGIALSGYGTDNDIRRSHEAGFAIHLTKPASREAIAEAIASVTTKRNRTGPRRGDRAV